MKHGALLVGTLLAIGISGCTSNAILRPTDLTVTKNPTIDIRPAKALPVEPDDEPKSTKEDTGPRLEIRFDNFEHSWECGLWNYCQTAYGGKVYLFNLDTGEIPVWNSVESMLQEGTPCTTDIKFNRLDTKHYRFEQYTDKHTFAWDHKRLEGRTQHISAKVIFRGDSGSYVVTWRSSNC